MKCSLVLFLVDQLKKKNKTALQQARSILHDDNNNGDGPNRNRNIKK